MHTSLPSAVAPPTPPQAFAGLPRRVHLLGAGGAGVSGAARLLLARGHCLSGHDRTSSDFVRALSDLGLRLRIGESRAEHLPDDAQLVVRSAAVPGDDPQLEEARRRGVEVVKYSRLVALLAPSERTLAVAGTHGKTSTAWLLWHALAACARATGKDAPAPAALVGGTNRATGTNAECGDPGGWFAVEACEYDRSFLQLAPRGAVLTNVEPDHLDYYGSYAALEEAFARFADRVHPSGLLVAGRHVPERVFEASRATVWRLGRELDVDLLGERRGRFRFRLRGPGWATPPIELRVPGAFHVENAALAAALAVWSERSLGCSTSARAVAEGLGEYPGAARRFEPWCRVGDVEVVHDYAHHPTEVRVTLEAARRALAGRALHVLFQPHQHSRTARFLLEFAEALRGADRVVVADVYGARNAIDAHAARAEDLVERLTSAGVDACAGGSALESMRELVRRAPARGALLVLGAGDIDGIRQDLENELALRGPRTRQPGR